MRIKISNYTCSCNCMGCDVKGFPSDCFSFSFDFMSGTYILQGEIDCGAWALVCSLASIDNVIGKVNYDSISINDIFTDYQSVANLSCYIHSDIKKRVAKKDFRTLIKLYIKKYSFYMSEDELFDLFDVPEHLRDRHIEGLGIYTPCFNAIIGLIIGKKIFMSQWCGEYSFNNYHVINKISKALKMHNCIFLIPASEYCVFDKSFNVVKMRDCLKLV